MRRAYTPTLALVIAASLLVGCRGRDRGGTHLTAPAPPSAPAARTAIIITPQEAALALKAELARRGIRGYGLQADGKGPAGCTLRHHPVYDFTVSREGMSFGAGRSASCEPWRVDALNGDAGTPDEMDDATHWGSLAPPWQPLPRPGQRYPVRDATSRHQIPRRHPQ